MGSVSTGERPGDRRPGDQLVNQSNVHCCMAILRGGHFRSKKA